MLHTFVHVTAAAVDCPAWKLTQEGAWFSVTQTSLSSTKGIRGSKPENTSLGCKNCADVGALCRPIEPCDHPMQSPTHLATCGRECRATRRQQRPLNGLMVARHERKKRKRRAFLSGTARGRSALKKQKVLCLPNPNSSPSTATNENTRPSSFDGTKAPIEGGSVATNVSI